MEKIGRRTVLRLCGGVVAGIITGSTSLDISKEVSKQVEHLTGHPVGNAGLMQLAEEAYKDYPDPNNCMQNVQLSPEFKALGVSVYPITEEFAFRAVPSIVLSVLEGKTDRLAADTLTGFNDGYGLSRRELVTGVASSLFFGVNHNITGNGIDLKTIPASQTIFGFAYWYLQRKFGLASNTIAHSLNNFSAFYR